MPQNFVFRTIVPLGALRDGGGTRRGYLIEAGVRLCHGERVGVSGGHGHVMRRLLSEYGKGDLLLSGSGYLRGRRLLLLWRMLLLLLPVKLIIIDDFESESRQVGRW